VPLALKKPTEPEAAFGETVAVNVTAVPEHDGLGFEVSTVEVGIVGCAKLFIAMHMHSTAITVLMSTQENNRPHTDLKASIYLKPQFIGCL
ncbi:MAG TPA: hypothetical protein VFZ42_08730, partial [Chitinophagaceae bacterium]